jgi:hypothetical protein
VGPARRRNHPAGPRPRRHPRRTPPPLILPRCRRSTPSRGRASACAETAKGPESRTTPARAVAWGSPHDAVH